MQTFWVEVGLFRDFARRYLPVAKVGLTTAPCTLRITLQISHAFAKRLSWFAGCVFEYAEPLR